MPDTPDEQPFDRLLELLESASAEPLRSAIISTTPPQPPAAQESDPDDPEDPMLTASQPLVDEDLSITGLGEAKPLPRFEGVSQGSRGGGPTADRKLRYDLTTVKPPDKTERFAGFTIVDAEGVVHKSTDRCKIVVYFVPESAKQTLEDLMETMNWVSSEQEMDAVAAVEIKEQLDKIKIVSKIYNPNAKVFSDADIIEARKKDLEKAHARNMLPENVKRAEKEAKAATAEEARFNWQDKVLSTTKQDENFIRNVSGQGPDQPPAVIQTRPNPEEGDGSRFENVDPNVDPTGA